MQSEFKSKAIQIQCTFFLLCFIEVTTVMTHSSTTEKQPKIEWTEVKLDITTAANTTLTAPSKETRPAPPVTDTSKV